MVRLADVDGDAQFLRAAGQAGGDVVERVMAVDLGLAAAEQVEVGAVQDKDSRGHCAERVRYLMPLSQ